MDHTLRTAVTMGSTTLAVLAMACAHSRRPEVANAGPVRERVPVTEEVAGARVATVRFTGEVTPTEQQRVLSDAQRIVADALAAVRRMDGSSDALAFRDYLHRAKGVFIFPNVTRDALATGAPGAGGILLAKRSDGTLSSPAFYSIGSGSAEVPLAFDRVSVALFLMNDGTVEDALGGGLDSASLATGTLTAEGHQGTLGSASDAISLVESDGKLYAGPSFGGTVIRPVPSLDAGYYGPGADARAVTMSDRFRTPSTVLLADTLSGMAAAWSDDAP